MHRAARVRQVIVVVSALVAVAVGLRTVGAVRLRAAGRAFVREYGVPEAPGSSCQRSGGAAGWLRAGALGLLLEREEKTLADALLTPGGARWTQAQRDAARRLVREHAPALELLHRAVGKPHRGFGVRGPSADVRFGLPLFPLMDASRVLAVEARLAFLDGEEERGRLALATMAVLATALERECFATAQGVGLIAERWLLGVAAERVAAGPFAATDLSQSIRGAVPAEDLRQAWRRRLKESVEADTWTDLEMRGTLRSRVLAPLLSPFWRARQHTTAVRLAATLDVPVDDAAHLEADSWAWWSPAAAQEGALLRLSQKYRAALAARQLAAVALDLLDLAADTGSYPERLETPGGAAGSDPFTGQPLAYGAVPGGGVRIEIPGGADRWRELFAEGGAPPPFAWRLPPPRPGRAPVAAAPPHSS